ncbi:MAG TPA: SLC13 family permease, partial [Opitutales bacterium]|nr:SLC13 family permease [Opitutales bacterium]
VVFMPVVLGLSRSLKVPASKLLIPLSYASIFGGTCTLIGTSTNILVSGMGESHGQPPLRMFELAQIGVPLLVIGALFLMFFGRRILPSRETLTSMLSEDERREYLAEAYVQSDSALVGQTLQESGILKETSFRVIEVVRSGVAIQADLKTIKLQAGDRLVIATRPSGMVRARSIEGFDFTSEAGLGLEQIAAHEGLLVEAVIPPNSTVIGRTMRELNFRQRFRMTIVAIHRGGVNVREQLDTLRLQFGDTLLMMGTEEAVQYLRSNENILLLDKPHVPAHDTRKKMPLVLATIATIIISSAVFGIPIVASATVGCVFLFITGCLKPKAGYAAIQWNLLFVIFGMLAMGQAMHETGASFYIANKLIMLVEAFVSDSWKPFAMLVCIYLLTSLMTEMISNNAAAVLILPIAFGTATALNVDPRPFMVATAIAASASFATPIGYQTNTYVYGAGGYKFSDFLKIGIPMNVLYFIVSMIGIPIFWKF